MDRIAVINNIGFEPFSRQDIVNSAHNLNTEFKDTQLRNLIGNMISNNEIVRVGRNLYKKAFTSSAKQTYSNKFSTEAFEIMRLLDEEYSGIKYQVWELQWLNEFLNHLVSTNYIFVDVENDGCEFVYSSLNEEYTGKILLKPTLKELDYYSGDNTVIIERLISESPKANNNEHGAPLEKIIVELFANKTLAEIISKGDYPMMIEEMFKKYLINQTKLFRYAKRRNKYEELVEYIRENTNIKLI